MSNSFELTRRTAQKSEIEFDSRFFKPEGHSPNCGWKAWLSPKYLLKIKLVHLIAALTKKKGAWRFNCFIAISLSSCFRDLFSHEKQQIC